MTTLYTMPGTCSLACNIAVAWLDAPVEIHNLAYGDHKNEEYLSINPKGKVPALKFDDGDVLTELAAIMAWLGAEHGSEGYARDKQLGYREAEALAYMTSEIHASYGPHFAAKNFAESEDAQSEVKEAAYKTLAGHYERLEDNLAQAGGEYYLGKRSFADAFLYVLTRWIEQTPLSIDEYPKLKAHRERMESDPGVRTALDRQDMELIG
ncbi:glutathione S-transferase family protein [Aurantiacibacter sediminis]|uniref:Glutathione S-transferase n=1 Tax=Aurantiacibacter sediminis TaxID=2793064 RepID=A0ABS0N5Z5_9SPHN|nr:glutathione S-transferase [Aurantiacibacter sediminis]MBH5323187.1 glutathione S-transferase [Aurantiacibacter sediminis]